MDGLIGSNDGETGEEEEEEDEDDHARSQGLLSPEEIELRIIDHDSINNNSGGGEDDEDDDDDVDGPRSRHISNGIHNADGGISDLFLFLTNPSFKERRNSARSSSTSIDTIHLKSITDKDRTATPKTDAELNGFVSEIADTCKKSSHIKEALKSSWVSKNPCYHVQDTVGNTVIHAAAALGEHKIVSVLGHMRCDVDVKNLRGDTALHLAALNDQPACIEALLKCGANTDAKNQFRFVPVQVAALKCHKDCLEILFKYGANHLEISEHNETLLHMACRNVWTQYLEIKEGLNGEIEKMESLAKAKYSSNLYLELEQDLEAKENRLFEKSFPVFKFLLPFFKRHPDLVEQEDWIETSPGTILHYFVCLNYLEGVKELLKEPFLLFASYMNKNKFSPLLLAAWYNHAQIGVALLDKEANPSDVEPERGNTPLHFAIEGYHRKRVVETIEFVDKLLTAGAKPMAVSKAGETPVHLAVKTGDFRVMAKFIDYIGPECLTMKDDNGNTLFHYAVGTLDDTSIYKLMERGANLMARSNVEVDVNEEGNIIGDNHNYYMGANGKREYQRARSIVIQKLPLQEAMKNNNSKNYFDALRRVDFDDICAKWTMVEKEEFLCSHLIAATREVRPDIVRLLFSHVTDDSLRHRILLYSDKTNEDDTFTKTALEWAVENNDRLSTTEILHQEYECHSFAKEAGLTCLRKQLTGDELLMWTIETFTMFYPKTFAQRNVIPLFGLIPLFMSISSFVYDYYSDIELTLEYYWNSTLGLSPPVTELNYLCNASAGNTVSETNLICSQTASVIAGKEIYLKSLNMVDDSSCHDITRTPREYLTAFIVNVVLVLLPLITFYAMCARELLPFAQDLQWKIEAESPRISKLSALVIYFVWLCVAFLCAPFFILYVAFKQVYYKFRHRRATRKNLFRRQLQKYEYLWGISRTAEAGLESCGQLILQVWLLSSHFKSLSQVSFWNLIDKAFTGIVFFLSFSYKPADDIEKSLGKMFMSLVALVFGVAACYRTLKRGAVKMSNTTFIYISLLLQILARMFSLGLYFFAVRSFFPNVPIILAIHFAIVFVIKWAFERARHTQGVLAWLVAVVNIFASSLVYVRIVPIEKQRNNNKKKCINVPSHAVQQHSTFFIQTIFFILVLVENLMLACTPLLWKPSGTNRALECLGKDKISEYIVVITALNIASWMFHIMYYKYMGHPWSDINGPLVSQRGVQFHFHCNGKERLFKWDLRGREYGEVRREDERTCCNISCMVAVDESEPTSREVDI